MTLEQPDRVNDVWGSRTPYDRGANWDVRVDLALADGVEEGTSTRGCGRHVCCAATGAAATSP